MPEFALTFSLQANFAAGHDTIDNVYCKLRKQGCHFAWDIMHYRTAFSNLDLEFPFGI